MKLQTPLLAIALLAASAPVAAQTRATLSMGGIIMPSSCIVTLAGGGTLSFGDIDYSALNETTSTDVPPRTVSTIFQCTGPTRFGVSIQDNRHDSSLAPTQAHAFGLGRTLEGKIIGMYKIEMNTPMANGAPGVMISSSNLQSWVTVDDTVPWGKLNIDGRQFRAFGEGLIPKALMEGTVNLRVTPTISPRNQLHLTQKTALSGNATLTIEYL